MPCEPGHAWNVDQLLLQPFAEYEMIKTSCLSPVDWVNYPEFQITFTENLWLFSSREVIEKFYEGGLLYLQEMEEKLMYTLVFM